MQELLLMTLKKSISIVQQPKVLDLEIGFRCDFMYVKKLAFTVMGVHNGVYLLPKDLLSPFEGIAK